MGRLLEALTAPLFGAFVVHIPIDWRYTSVTTRVPDNCEGHGRRGPFIEVDNAEARIYGPSGVILEVKIIPSIGFELGACRYYDQRRKGKKLPFLKISGRGVSFQVYPLQRLPFPGLPGVEVAHRETPDNWDKPYPHIDDSREVFVSLEPIPSADEQHANQP